MSLTDLIDVRPGVRGRKPCFVGTRITVYDVLEYLAGGMTADEIVAGRTSRAVWAPQSAWCRAWNPVRLASGEPTPAGRPPTWIR